MPDRGYIEDKNIIHVINDCISNVISLDHIKIIKRGHKNIFLPGGIYKIDNGILSRKNNNNYYQTVDLTNETILYLDIWCHEPISLANLDPLYLYYLRIGDPNGDADISTSELITSAQFWGREYNQDIDNIEDFAPYVIDDNGNAYYFDGHDEIKRLRQIGNNLYKCQIDDAIIDLSQYNQDFYEIKTPSNYYETLINGPGLILELSYTKQKRNYTIEDTNELVKTAKQRYLNTIDNWTMALNESAEQTPDYKTLQTQINNSYLNYNTVLYQQLDKYRKNNGIAE